MSEDCIIHEVLYPYPIWTVWRALTNSEALAQWLMPNDFVPEIGHRFTMHAEASHGWKGIIACQVKELKAPYRLAFSWQGGGNTPTTLVSFTLEAVDLHTRLRLEHSGFTSGSAAGITIRNLLDSGWGSKLLQGHLATLLETLSTQ